MHINSDRLIESLSEIELLHIESCTQCKTERQKLIALKASANQIDLIQPPIIAWNNIAPTLTVKINKTNRIRKILISTAASVFMVSISWLMWSNYSLQHQLEQVLLINKTIENQLVQDRMPTFHQTQLLSKIRLIDLQLINATTSKEKLNILKHRQKLMTEMVSNSKGKEYEYSI
jgi:hypothetical protein